ncbi:serine/threonine-protein phosphatase 2A 65 kDa regulatory subunit A alpha isoform-like [Schistocerca cancellata]|uniref:serine/threonine-protein phosphatase 2A 65 kDa regulatory subunit A alpha isoform-like n=1 Tax=Schistocerca cancellata TaxID=274614 RepID=UPI0021187601|nr:serine/threonine-protein phosphatase 2A 65 kDa regulatory subunit A alpha isoform-like [Schistocerca cancellata]
MKTDPRDTCCSRGYFPSATTVLKTSLEYTPTTEEPDVCDTAQCWKRETTPTIFRQYFEDRFVSLLSILTAEESIKSRILARTLLCKCYAGLSQTGKAFVRQIYYRLCVDESVAVRENAARKLDQFAKLVDLSHFEVDIIPLFHMLQKDEEVIIRLAAAESLVNILMYQRVSGELCRELLSELQKYINDPSSSVRYLIVIKIVETALEYNPTTEEPDVCDTAQCWKRETTPTIFRQYFEDRFVSLLSILTAEESIKSRILARTLMCKCYAGLSQAGKAFVRQTYYRLCIDESVAVRENAARKLDEFAKVVDLSHFEVDIIPLFHMLQKDKEVIIRLAAAESLVNILMYQRVPDELCRELLSELQKYINDPSSSVRYLIVTKIVEVLRGLQEGTLKSDLLQMLDDLLKSLT